MTQSSESDDPETSQTRLELLWDVLVFQMKLGVDGLRDVILVPVSMLAAIIGLLFGGSKPDQYFNRVLEFGRRTEHWINLFGHRRLSGTSDEIIKPLQEKVFEEAGNRPWLRQAGSTLNKSLDKIGNALESSSAPSASDSDEKSGPRD